MSFTEIHPTDEQDVRKRQNMRSCKNAPPVGHPRINLQRLHFKTQQDASGSGLIEMRQSGVAYTL